MDDAAKIRAAIPPWYPLVTEPGGERRALRSLYYNFLSPFVPWVRTVEIVANGLKKLMARPMLPGYVFVHLPENFIGLPPKFTGRNDLLELPGIAAFMRIDRHTKATLSEDAIAFLRAIEADLARPRHRRRVLCDAPKASVSGLQVGQKVRTWSQAGAWAGYEAKIIRLDERDRATIEIIAPGLSMVRVTLDAQRLKAV